MEYRSLDEVLIENEELRLKIDSLMSRFSGCGNCIHQNKVCSSKLPNEKAYCEDYQLDSIE